jgi:arylsulfatase A-like enzyme
MNRADRPNILFLMADQQQQATVLPGSPCRMPNVSRLRESGVLFSNAHTVNAICAPARASLMTGLYPHNHGMVDNTHTVEEFRANFRQDRNMISRQLKAQGYRLGYFGKWHVERSINPGAFGFDRFVTEEHGLDFPRTLTRKHVVRQPGYNDRTLYGVHREPVEETEEHYFYSQGIEFIREMARAGFAPWCLFISTNAPHDPYIAPQELYEMYDPSLVRRPPSFGDPMEDKPNIYRRVKQVWKDLAWPHYQEAIACYYAYCTLVDRQVGRALAALEETGQLDNTIVVYLSDHGDMMGGHGLFAKGVPAFEEVYRIPLIIRGPGIGPAGTASGVPVSVIDVAPTVLDLAGCAPMRGIDGESIVPDINGGPEPAGRSLYAEFYGQRLSYSQRIVWKGGCKYVYNGFDFDELYDLRQDPHEINNLIDDPRYRTTVESLAREMWRKAKESGDTSFLESEYFMYRFAPVGPEREKQASIYNRGA